MKKYPPFLDEVIERCPKASYLYTLFWRQKDLKNNISLSKEYITNGKGLQWRVVKNDLRLLKMEGALDFSLNAENDLILVTFYEKASSVRQKAA